MNPYKYSYIKIKLEIIFISFSSCLNVHFRHSAEIFVLYGADKRSWHKLLEKVYTVSARYPEYGRLKVPSYIKIYTVKLQWLEHL